MIRFFDKLNTPRALIVVLALILLVDGFLFYQYRLSETTAASAPSLEDAVPAAAKEDGVLSEQEDEQPGDKETSNEADQSDGEKKGELEARESDSTSAPTPYPPASAPAAGFPPVAAEDAAVLPAQEEAPVPAYPEPAYEEELPYDAA